MSSSLGSLLTSRRFGPLFVTQFLGAFNDNLLKNALGIYVIFVLVTGTGAAAGVDIGGQRISAANLILLAQALFIAPFFLFSGVSGTLADRLDKAVIARWVKVVEIGIMATGGLGLWLANVPLLLTAVFALGTHSTVFGPIKYALLPQQDADLATALVLGVVLQPVTFSAYGRLPATLAPIADRLVAAAWNVVATV